MPQITRKSCALLLCGLLIMTAACTNAADEPLEYADEPIWSGADLGAGHLRGATLHGDTALLPTTGPGGGTLAATQLTTGHTLWSADDGEPLVGGRGAVADHRGEGDPVSPVVRDLDDEWEVLIPYRRTIGDPPAGSSGEAEAATGGPAADPAAPESSEYGIAAVSGDDGSVRWLSEPMVADDGRSSPTTAVRPLYADEDTVVVASVDGDGSEAPVTRVLDAATGEERWTAEGMWPTALAGQTVTLEETDDPNGFWQDDGPSADDASVEARHATHGEMRWDFADDFEASGVYASSGEHLVVHAEGSEDDREDGGSGNSTLLVRAASGEILDEIGNFEICYASDVMIACRIDEELLTYPTDQPETEGRTSQPFGSGRTASHWDVLGVYGETVAVRDETEDTPQVRALDAEGRTRAEDLPGVPTAMTEEYAAFCDDAQDTDAAACGIHAVDPALRTERPAASQPPALDLGEPLWDSDAYSASEDPGLESVHSVQLVRDSVVLHGEHDADDTLLIVVAGAESGDARWAVDGSQPMSAPDGLEVDLVMSPSPPALAEAEDGWSMLVAGESAEGMGVASLAGDTGDLEWFLPLEGELSQVWVTGVEAGRAAVRVVENDRTRTSVIDLDSVEEEWRHPDSRPTLLGDDSLLVRDLDPGDDGDQRESGLSLLSLDEEGETLWSAEYADPRAVLVNGGSGLVLVSEPDGTSVLDPASGDVLATVGRRLSGCAEDGESLVCGSSPVADRDRPVSPVAVRPADGGAEVRELRSAAIFGVDGVHQDRVFVEFAGDTPGSGAMDLDGAVVDTELPEGFRAANEDGLALFTDGEELRDVSWEIRRMN